MAYGVKWFDLNPRRRAAQEKGPPCGSPERKTVFAGPGFCRRPRKQSVAIAVLENMVQRAAAAADQRSGRRAPSSASRRADAGADGRGSGDRQDGFQLGITTASYGPARRTVDHFLSGGAGDSARPGGR